MKITNRHWLAMERVALAYERVRLLRTLWVIGGVNHGLQAAINSELSSTNSARFDLLEIVWW